MSQKKKNIEKAIKVVEEEKAVSAAEVQEIKNNLPEPQMQQETNTPELPLEKAEEPVPPSNKSKESFFLELEKNIQSLRELKKRAAGVKEEKKTPVNDFLNKKQEGERVVSDFFRSGATLNAGINDINENQSLEVPKAEPVIFTSRWEEVLTTKEDKVSNEADVILNYFNYLETERNKFIKDKKNVDKLIERFIKEDPSIPYLNIHSIKNQKQEDLSEKSAKPKYLLSENYANILIRQGNFDKAIQIYQELSLKNPEKKAYFASQIEKLKNK